MDHLHQGEEDPFQYTRAVVCAGVPASLPAAALRAAEPGSPVDLQKATSQHQRYTEVIQGLVKEVHVIPMDNQYPDAVFVEDPVVVCGDTALLPILGHESRRGESLAMKELMEKLGLRIVEMVDPGRLDGGDVLFTGKEFFVGQSKRTNESGLSQLAAAFPGYQVTGVPVTEGLHLKSFMTMAGPSLIAISTSSPVAHAARKVVEEKGSARYQFFEVPDNTGANCVYLNNTIIHVAKEALPSSWEKYKKLNTSAKKVSLDTSELNKVDGCLTCSSVLIK